MPTALVTGASGFLGRYIVRELVTRQWRVTGIDRTAMTRAEADQLGLDELQVMELPIPGLEPLLATLEPEVIVHAAGPASVPLSVRDPATDFRESTHTLLDVLDAVRRSKLPSRVVYLSSAAVYGNPSNLPVSEDAPMNPISPYGYHKLMGEKLIDEYHRIYGVPGCCVRIFSAYGRGLRRQVLWDVAQKILHQPAVELIGTGDEARDFVHAADVARGIAAVIDHGAFEAEVYNLASGRETSIFNLARMLADALGRSPKFVFSGAGRTGDPLRWCADVSRLAKLGFQPQFTIRDGAADYARWILEQAESVA